jgi:predicted ribosome quality control (RQC) complex YloA/Tae2 family protein
MNHYFFKYSVELSKDYFINKRISSVSIYSPSSFKIEFAQSQYGLYVNLSPQNSFLFPTQFSLKAEKINDAVFLVFLKKKLPGLIVHFITQKDSERITYFNLIDKRGTISNSFNLIFEIMDRRSNAIFTDEKLEIMQAYKHININRQIMPHKKYIQPISDMPDLLDDDTERLFLRFKHNEDILGLNRTLRSTINDKSDFLKLINTIKETFKNKSFNVYLNKKEIYPFPISDSAQKVDEEFIFKTYIEKPKNSEFINRKKNLKNILTKRLKSLQRRLIKVENELSKSQNADDFRIIAENLLSKPTLNVRYKTSITIDDIYTKKPLTIKLNPQISLFDNAQNYFKKFKRAKKSKEMVEKRLNDTYLEIEFIEQLIFDIDNAKNEKDLNDIKDIMIKESIIRINQNKQKQTTYKPYEHLEIDGFDAYIGKNAKGNDYVTLKLAAKNDYWFHSKGRPGAHLILKNPNRLQNIGDNVKIVCAQKVAQSSKAQVGEKIEVDYTLAKYVKKPKGFKTGMVIYSNFKTVTVTK